MGKRKGGVRKSEGAKQRSAAWSVLNGSGMAAGVALVAALVLLLGREAVDSGDHQSTQLKLPQPDRQGRMPEDVLLSGAIKGIGPELPPAAMVPVGLVRTQRLSEEQEKYATPVQRNLLRLAIEFCGISFDTYKRDPTATPFFADLMNASGCSSTTVQMPVISVLGAVARKFGAPSSSWPGVHSIVVHTARSGSTAVSNSLAAVPGVVMLSEPGFLLSALQFAADGDLTEDELVILLRLYAALCLQGAQDQLNIKNDAKLSMKLSSAVPLVFDGSLWTLARAWASTVRFAFIFRHPTEVLSAHYASAAARTDMSLRSALGSLPCCRSRAATKLRLIDNQVTALGLNTSVPQLGQLALQLPAEGYCAAHIAAIFAAVAELASAADRNGLADVLYVDQRSLPSSIIDRVIPHLKLRYKIADKKGRLNDHASIVQQVAGRDAKANVKRDPSSPPARHGKYSREDDMAKKRSMAAVPESVHFWSEALAVSHYQSAILKSQEQLCKHAIVGASTDMKECLASAKQNAINDSFGSVRDGPEETDIIVRARHLKGTMFFNASPLDTSVSEANACSIGESKSAVVSGGLTHGTATAISTSFLNQAMDMLDEGRVGDAEPCFRLALASGGKFSERAAIMNALTELEDTRSTLMSGFDAVYTHSTNAFTVEGLFSPEECEQLIKFGHEHAILEEQEAKVGLGSDSRSSEDLRVSHAMWMCSHTSAVACHSESATSKFGWATRRIIHAVRNSNNHQGGWHLDWSALQLGLAHSDVKLLKYSVGGKFVWHSDAVPAYQDDPRTRIITITVQLTLSKNYTGGGLQIGAHMASREQGDLVAYISAAPHTVRPVTEGARHAIVMHLWTPHKWDGPELTAYWNETANRAYETTLNDMSKNRGQRDRPQVNDADRADVTLLKAQHLSGLSRHDEAVETFAAATTLNSESFRLWHRRGLQLGKVGRFSEASHCFFESVALQPSDVTLRYDAEVALSEQRRYPEAIDMLERALELGPDQNGDYPTYRYLGLNLQMAGRTVEADAAFDKYLSGSSNTAGEVQAHVELARLFLSLEPPRRQEAYRLYRKATTLNPDDGQIEAELQRQLMLDQLGIKDGVG